MDWKDNDIMKIASRGTLIEDDSFIGVVEHVKTKYGTWHSDRQRLIHSSVRGSP